MHDLQPTPVHTLRAAQQIAEQEGIRHVYLGNV
jgi:pyruvate-formate lyase-activating enzyme